MKSFKLFLITTVLTAFAMVMCGGCASKSAEPHEVLVKNPEAWKQVHFDMSEYPKIMANPYVDFMIRKQATWEYMCRPLDDNSPLEDIRKAVDQILYDPQADHEIKAEILASMAECRFEKPYIDVIYAHQLLLNTKSSYLKVRLLWALQVQDLQGLDYETDSLARRILNDETEEDCVRESAAQRLDHLSADEKTRRAIERHQSKKEKLRRGLGSEEFYRTWCPHRNKLLN